MKVGLLKWPLELLSCHLHCSRPGSTPGLGTACVLVCVLLQLAMAWCRPAAVLPSASPQTSCVCINNVSCGHLSYLPCICIMYHRAAISGELTQSEDSTARFHHHCYQTQIRQIYGTKFPSLFRATQHTLHNTQHTSHPHIPSDMKEFVLNKSVNIKLDNRPDELHCIVLTCVFFCVYLNQKVQQNIVKIVDCE